MTSVTVLVPNGRRQNVKVTPNTTLLQVLEDVCKKHGLNPNEHDMKHYNKILDLTTIIRFSGLPNNAQLELVQAKALRQESKVHIALQVGECTTRVTGDFWPSDSLMLVVQTLSSEELNVENKTPVVIYMRKEMIGVDNLHTTQLKTLGLTGGSAVLRLVLRDSDLPPEQKTSGSAVYFRPPVTPKQPVFEPEKQSKNQITCESVALDHEMSDTPPQSTSDNVPSTSTSMPCTSATTALACSAAMDRLSSTKAREQEIDMEITTAEPDPVVEEEICYIGERNALLFSQADVTSTPELLLPDDFFELTIDDFRILSRDYKKTLRDIEDAPLQTSSLRELQKTQQVLNRLNYKDTVIRIQFPDRLVLQGIFKPTETVSHVMQFVAQFLHQPHLQFYLYRTPPKTVMEADSHLVEADCVPRALLYFGVTDCDTNTTYLHSTYLSQITTPRQALRAAMLAVRKSKSFNSQNDGDQSMSQISNKINENHSDAVVPSTSQPTGRVPKWFKK